MLLVTGVRCSFLEEDAGSVHIHRYGRDCITRADAGASSAARLHRDVFRQTLLVAAGMDDEDVAARSTRDVLADAPAEQPLEKAGFAGADDDQLGLMLFGGVDKLLRRLAGYASEVDLQVGVGEESLHPLAVLFPQLLVPLDNLTGVAGRIGVVGPQTERAGSAGLGERLWRDDTDDHHLRGEGACVLSCTPEGVLGGRRSVIADDDRLLRGACGLGPHRPEVFPHNAPVTRNEQPPAARAGPGLTVELHLGPRLELAAGSSSLLGPDEQPS